MDYLAINQAAWNKRTQVHVESDFYDVEAFIRGRNSLNTIELAEVGSVVGKRLLHLQCHFGLDTLSWARLGAKVMGIDLSSESISVAKRLAEKLDLKADFICSDVYQFGETNQEKFDIVFTSYGALCWLLDLNQWASTIASSLEVGGQFNLVEFHPFNELLAGYSYFSKLKPDIEQEGTYTENCPGEKLTMVTWSHSLAEVINALVSVGIAIQSFKEFPYSPYNCFDNLEALEGSGYQRLLNGQQVPLVYSIKGIKTHE